MAFYRVIKIRFVLASVAAMLLVVSCDKLKDVVEKSEISIKSHLKNLGIYERNNVPEDLSPTVIKGYYDIVGGAFRYITNEDREGRSKLPEIKTGDKISFYFDGRIFSSSYDNSTTFFTNIANRIETIANNNPQFDMSEWSVDPKIITIGDGSILKAIQQSLPSCRPGDIIKIFLPPNVAYGDKQAGVVPARSTLVFELINIEIIE